MPMELAAAVQLVTKTRTNCLAHAEKLATSLQADEIGDIAKDLIEHTRTGADGTPTDVLDNLR